MSFPSTPEGGISSLNAFLADPIVAAKLDPLVACLSVGYKNAGDNYKPQVGSDGRTAGMDVYTFVWFQINQSGLVNVTPKEPYWMDLGGAQVACHRVATQSHQPIASSFPRDRTGWPTTNVMQQALSFVPSTPTVNNILVLAHVGNPREGLLAVYLCRPLIDESGYLVKWLETELIWARSAASSSEPPPPPNSDSDDALPPEESKPKAKATPKKKDKKQSGES